MLDRATLRLIASYVALLPLQVALFFAAEASNETLGGLFIFVLLLAGIVVDGVFGSSSALDWLVWLIALWIYFATYSVLVLPAHFLARKHAVIHALALTLVVIGYALVVTFAFPLRGLPI